METDMMGYDFVCPDCGRARTLKDPHRLAKQNFAKNREISGNLDPLGLTLAKRLRWRWRHFSDGVVIGMPSNPNPSGNHKG
jgi:hypothetical protein